MIWCKMNSLTADGYVIFDIFYEGDLFFNQSREWTKYS